MPVSREIGLVIGDWTNRMTAPGTAQFEYGAQAAPQPIFWHFE